MHSYIILVLSILLGNIFSQVEMNISYEVKYGNGKQVITSGNKKSEDYNYLENLLDINTYFGESIYLYTQLEYSDPPIFGYNKKGINTFYIEYQQDALSIKLGDLYELFGRGMSIYTSQDQNVDYNNSIQGLSVNYLINDNLSISLLNVAFSDFSSLKFNSKLAFSAPIA